MKKAALISVFASAVLCLVVLTACGGSVEIKDTVWVPSSADNASGDEVDIREVYNSYYSNYQGTLSFESNGTFELWLSPGNPTDGTHTGTYELAGDKINVLFDDDTQSQFDIVTKGEKQCIVVTYDGYKVYFTKQ